MITVSVEVPKVEALFSSFIIANSKTGSSSETSSLSSQSSNMAFSSLSVLNSRIPWPRSLMPGFRIHHSRSAGRSASFFTKLSCSS